MKEKLEKYFENSQSTYWKWIFGSISLINLKYPNNQEIIKLKEIYEKCYEEEIEKKMKECKIEEKIENDYEEDENQDPKFATLDKLIDLIIENKKTEFRDHFFLTFRSFTSSYNLLNLFIDNFFFKNLLKKNLKKKKIKKFKKKIIKKKKKKKDMKNI
jgi:hypothetical protein